MEKNGEIPKVFRSGQLKTGSESDLSRLMSEIEKNNNSDFDDIMKDELDIFDDNNGNTSVDS